MLFERLPELLHNRNRGLASARFRCVFEFIPARSVNGELHAVKIGPAQTADFRFPQPRKRGQQNHGALRFREYGKHGGNFRKRVGVGFGGFFGAGKGSVLHGVQAIQNAQPFCLFEYPAQKRFAVASSSSKNYSQLCRNQRKKPMDLATQELIKRLHQLGPNGRAELDDAQVERIESLLTAAKHDEIDALCRQEVASFDAGPLLWLTRYTKTENPQYEEQGVPFLAGFPRKSYFVPLFDAFLARHRQLYIPKSRTMMTSWAAAGFATWAAQWKQEETVIQTMNEDKALHLIDYASQLLRYQDPGLSRLHPIKKQNVTPSSLSMAEQSTRLRGELMRFAVFTLRCSFKTKLPTFQKARKA